MPLASPTDLMVSTRFGPVYFTTRLEWDEAVALCREVAAQGNKFASDMIDREDSNKFMSESQVCWVYKMAEDLLQSREPKPEVRSTDASNILASVAEARAKGIKKPALRLLMPSDNYIEVKYMSMGKNAGGCWVTSNGNLIGKIDDCGVFTFIGKPYTHNFICDVFEFIESVNSDVKGSIESFGRLTSKCGCCGRPLSDPKSVALNVGPVCLEKFFGSTFI